MSSVNAQAQSACTAMDPPDGANGAADAVQVLEYLARCEGTSGIGTGGYDLSPQAQFGNNDHMIVYLPNFERPAPANKVKIQAADTAGLADVNVVCSTATVADNNSNLVTVELADNASCSLTVKSNLSGDWISYSAMLSRVGVEYRLAAGTAKGGNFGGVVTAPVIATATTTTEEEQQQAAATHTQNRATNIANNQPNVTGFIDGTFEQGGGSLGNFGLVANEAGFTSRFSSSLGRIWSEMDRNTAKAMAGSASNGTTPAYVAQDKALQNGLILAPASAEGEQSQTAAVVDPELSLSVAIKSNADENTYGSTASVENTSQLSAAQQRGYDVWMQVYGAKSEAGNSKSTLWIGYAGAHKFINPNFLIGGLVQMDLADESNNTAGSSADGTGWMVGPYMAYKAPDQNLFFDARAAWGRSDNDITTAGATGSFDTERWMVSAKVSGLFRENGWDIRPAVSASYFEETQESYTDSTNTVIASQTFTQGEIRFGPTFSYDMLQDDGSTIRPKFGVNGVWNFDVNNGASSQGAVLGSGDIRARFDAGVAIIGTNMWSLDVSGFYDGIGINNYEAYGGKARITVPLN